MPAPLSRPPAAARPRRLQLALTASGAGVLTVAIRLAMLTRSFDVFGDEVIYAVLGHSAATGGFPRYHREIFFLHPPGFLYLEAAWQWLLGYRADLFSYVYELRILNAILAAVTAVVLVLLASRAGSLRAGMAAGLLFALEPYAIRLNDRVLIETSMMLWVLLGYLVLSSLIGRPLSRRARLIALAAGLLFGCAVLTKDEAVLVTVLPLLVIWGLGWGPRRQLTLLTVGATAVPYAIYLVVVAANGYFPALWAAKSAGAGRLAGAVQETGFHRAGGASLTGRLLTEAPYFTATYVILALSVPAMVLLLWRGGQLPRVLGVLAAAGLLAVGYALAFGTLEEQQLYLLLAPAVAIVPVAATVWVRRPGGPSWLRPRAVCAALLVAVLGLDLTTCVRWLVSPDNGYARVRQYLAARVAPGEGVSEAGNAALLLDDRFRVGEWLTPAQRARARARYLVVPWGLVDQHYSNLDPAQVRRAARQGRLVFSFRGRSYGTIDVYELPLPPARGG